jgi:hypothetical protein
MKVSATLWLLFLLSVCKAQSADPTAAKLEHYKELYNQKLINDYEYQHLKARLLHIPFEMTMNLDSAHASELKQRYRSQILTGSCLIGIGLGIAVVGGITASLVSTEQPRVNGTTFICVGAGGGFIAIAGAVLVGLGQRDRTLYNNNYIAITLTGTGNQVGLACNF